MAKASALQLAESALNQYSRPAAQDRTSPASHKATGYRITIMGGTESPPYLALLPPLPAHLEKFTPSLCELSDLLGCEWVRVSSEPYLLAQWAALIRTNRMVEAGVIPPAFIYPAECQSCGPISLDYKAGTALEACPWCFSRCKPNFTTP